MCVRPKRSVSAPLKKSRGKRRGSHSMRWRFSSPSSLSLRRNAKRFHSQQNPPCVRVRSQLGWIWPSTEIDILREFQLFLPPCLPSPQAGFAPRPSRREKERGQNFRLLNESFGKRKGRDKPSFYYAFTITLSSFPRGSLFWPLLGVLAALARERWHRFPLPRPHC